MALPTVTSRPEKTVDSAVSRWNAANLPLIYSISNDKWPVNSLDDSDTSVSITESTISGYAMLNPGLTPVGAALSVNDWVKVSDSLYYDGVFRIIDKGVGTLTLDTGYTQNDTCDYQHYYKNYTSIVRVYAGISSDHTHTAEDPVSLIGTIEQRPDSDNITDVDVRNYVKNKLNTNYDDSQDSWPNDLNAWTDFYISFAERYDEVVGGEVVNTTSSYTDDTEGGNIIYLKAVQSALQFGNVNGGNMGDYLISSEIYATEAKWLTFFERSKLYDFNKFDLSVINEVLIGTLDISQYDSNDNLLLTENFTVNDEDYGVYRFNLLQVDWQNGVEYITVKTSAGGYDLTETHTVDIDDLCAVAPDPIIPPLTGVITLGSPLNFETDVALFNTAIFLSDGKFINTWYDSVTTEGKCRAFEINSDSLGITELDSELTITNMSSSPNSAKIDDTHILTAWRDDNGDGRVQVFEIDLDTGVVTALDSAFEFDTTDADYISVSIINSTKATILYSSGDLFAQSITYNSTTGVISNLGSRNTLSADNARDVSNVIISSNFIMATWKDNATDDLKLQVFEVNTSTGSVTAPGSAFTFQSAGGGGAPPAATMLLLTEERLQVFWTDASPGIETYSQVFDISTDGSISALLTPEEFSTGDSLASVLLNSTQSVTAWQLTSTSGFMQVFDATPSTGEVEPLLVNEDYEVGGTIQDQVILKIDSNTVVVVYSLATSSDEGWMMGATIT